MHKHYNHQITASLCWQQCCFNQCCKQFWN